MCSNYEWGISLSLTYGGNTYYVFLPYLFIIFPRNTQIKIAASDFNGFDVSTHNPDIYVLSSHGSYQIIEYY